ncbi:hypothetical protein EYC80_005807 [Monilinia laxa]|uniref:Alpha/beta hydrolase fold-3 domain-containing protein n=1 Tax=Monilinia laxa TaxID=61186 RepID=A0A5N6KF40_MONLA|nr:hypothetical protein EYC80_005807 [Monilinia laxa]
MDSPKFSQFDVSVVTYKTVQNHNIQTYILIPKNISPGPHPVIVKIHGGGSVSGSGIQPNWFATYLLTLALQNSAIILAPNYRLLPESSAPEMISDISTFWDWIRGPGLRAALPPHLAPDLPHTLLYGDSAGGHLAVLSALTQPPGTIQACIAAYPQLDLESAYFTTASEKHPFGSPMLPPDLLSSHLASLHPDPAQRIPISDAPDAQERLLLILVALQQGRYRELFGAEDGVYPFRVLERRIAEGGGGGKLPFLWVYHGEGDSVLPVEGSEKFVGRWREGFGEEAARLYVHRGEDSEHGF